MKEAKLRVEFTALVLNAIGLVVVMLKHLPWWKGDAPPVHIYYREASSN